MSKKKNLKKVHQQLLTSKKIATTPTVITTSSWSSFLENRAQWFFFGLAIALYIQTASYDYTMDDAIVITDNMFTTQGIKGIPDIFYHDTFYGFFKEAGKEQLVSGGRYRPFTLAMFAIEIYLFGLNPFFSHLVNILLFALTCLLLYRLLKKLFGLTLPQVSALPLAFMVTLFFTVHPIHSEVVANIKGRDEIMSLLGCFLALLFGLKWIDTRKTYYLVVAMLSFFTGILSKENAISLLVWFPAALYIFKKKNIGKALIDTFPFFCVVILFLIIRTIVLNGTGFSGSPGNELLNNPFLKWEDGSMIAFSIGEKTATIFQCLGMYLKLLIFPHPLTHDYYPRHIPLLNLNNVWVIISIILNVSLFGTTISLALKRHVLGFAGLLYWAPLLIVSNLFFPIGTNMGERFAYMSSTGFCIALSFLLQFFFKDKIRRLITIYLATGIALLFSLKTVTRNPAWKNNLILFQTDIKTSTESAKLNNAIGSEYVKLAANMKDGIEKEELINNGIHYLEKAITLHPMLKNAFLNLGNARMHLKKPDSAIVYYNKSLAIDPTYSDARNNLSIAYRTIGRNAGEKESNLVKATEYLNKAYTLNPDDYETLRLLGVLNGINGDNTKAIDYFTKALAISKENASAYYDLGIAYKVAGNIELGKTYIDKAIQLDPAIIQKKQGQK